jgi:hypothetical protein
MNLSDHIIRFYRELEYPAFLPDGVQVMNPYINSSAMEYVDQFYKKFFSDNNPRVMVIGINPGRFGGGVTGIPFTDPINLKQKCGIENDLDERHELSSKFIYEMIEALGGSERFYSGVFITAASPLGFVRDGKNLNYYDDQDLLKNWEPFILDTLKQQAKFCQNNAICFSLGQGKNYKLLQNWNKEYRIFGEVRALPHPRWVMQYRLKRKEEFIEQYQQALSSYL